MQSPLTAFYNLVSTSISFPKIKPQDDNKFKYPHR